MKLSGRTCQRTLTWVNRIRAEDGKRPLKRLPKGKSGSGESCPVAKATGYPPGGYISRALYPDYVRDFVRAFDLGRIPELEA